MNDEQLQNHFSAAREDAAARRYSREEFGFETRVLARIGMSEQHGIAAPGVLARLWKSLAVCAAIIGFLCFWMLSGGTLDLAGESPHWALWGGADQAMNLFPN